MLGDGQFDVMKLSPASLIQEVSRALEDSMGGTIGARESSPVESHHLSNSVQCLQFSSPPYPLLLPTHHRRRGPKL